MTISAKSSSEGYDIKYTTDNVVATHKLKHGEKVYTVKIYYESEWEPSDDSAEMVSSIGCVKMALDVFKAQLEEDSMITLTHEDKLLVGKTGKDESESYTFPFKDCLPADHVEVYVGELEEVDEAPKDLDHDEPIDSAYSESDILLCEEHLKESEREAGEAYTPHVPVKNSSISKSSQKSLQKEPHCFSHMVSPRDSRGCCFSAFFCVLATAFAQKMIDNECVKSVEASANLWADSCGIAKSKQLAEAMEQGFECIGLLSKNPNQANLRVLMQDPKAQASVNFTLRQIALLGISLHPHYVEKLLPEGSEERTITKLQKELFEKTKLPGKEVDLQVIAILEQVFNLDFKLLYSDVSSEDSTVIEKDFSHSGNSNIIEGVAIFEENGHHYVLLNQRVFHFV